MKQCTKCGETKEYSEFGICKRYLDGYRSSCKICFREYQNKWAKDKVELKRASRTRYRERNRNHIRKMDRKYYVENADKLRESSKKKMKVYLENKGVQTRIKSKNDFPEKIKARELLKTEVRSGRMKKPDQCQICSGKPSRIEAHHHDYNKPLEVVWLCAPCHRKVHRKND